MNNLFLTRQLGFSVISLQWLLVLLVVIASAGVRAGDQEDRSIEQALSDLGGDSFAERIAAQRHLASVAANNIELLAEIGLTAEKESAERIVSLLETVFLRDDGPRGELAEKALEILWHNGGHASIPARKVLHGNALLRESRARKAIEKLGGELVYYKPDAIVNSYYIFESKFQIAPEIGAGLGPPAMLYAVYLHENWKGTREDLWHLQRLAHHTSLVIYSIRGNSVDLNDLFSLAHSLPGLSIQERGACLGIRADNVGGPCVVGEVVSGGAADRAGLQAGDMILQLGETEIRSFPHLVEELKTREVGEELVFHVLKTDQPRPAPVQVKLGSWSDVSTRDSNYVPAPPPIEGPFQEVPLVNADDSGVRAVQIRNFPSQRNKKGSPSALEEPDSK